MFDRPQAPEPSAGTSAVAQPSGLTPASGTAPAVAVPAATVRHGIPIWVAAVAIAVIAIGAGAYFYMNRAPVLSSKDSVILADFTNTTGDAMFDGTLRQGLSAQLAQSPFLNIVADQQVAATMPLMGQPAGARLTDALAKQVCQRTGAAGCATTRTAHTVPGPTPGERVWAAA